MRRARREGPLQEGVYRGDTSVHRGLGSLRAAGSPGSHPQDRRGGAARERPQGYREARVLRVPLGSGGGYRVSVVTPPGKSGSSSKEKSMGFGEALRFRVMSRGWNDGGEDGRA